MPGPVQSIARAAAILRLLARGAGCLGVGEIADSLDLARPTAHGILRTLRQVGFVEQDRATAKYRIGGSLADLATRCVDVDELRSCSRNWADALATRSREAVRIGCQVEGGVLVVHHVFRPDSSPQALDTGTSLPLHATALGKVLLASDPDLAAAAADRGLDSLTRCTITTPDVLGPALRRVRDVGWAAEIEEFMPGVVGVAAPIRGYGGLVVGAVGVSGAAERICGSGQQPKSALVNQVCETAGAISRDLATHGF
ncbi:IclR family transcriptional regulator [Saccharopolyspora sp. 5N708]|uniref:IclR family transcriptional regulator n=1 Tax=Saccharopolyspora sp. 5N708 TaxID=3457424 RepID=UPI003FD3E73E